MGVFRCSRGLVLAGLIGASLAALGQFKVSSLKERFQTHIDFLASDKLEGRGVGTPGIEQAAEYIAACFQKARLTPAGDSESYFQAFPITLQRELTEEGRLAPDGGEANWRQGHDFIPLSFSSDDEFSGPVAFCGYGIVAQDKNWDDFSGVNVSGRVVLMFRGEPPSWADTDGSQSHYSLYRNKVYNAKDRGAVGVLFVNQNPGPGESDTLSEFLAHGADEYGIPAFHVSRDVAEELAKKGGLGTLVELQTKLDGGQRTSAELPHRRITGKAAFQKRTAPTKNVLGIHRGLGPLGDEFIVIGAHYDHLGNTPPMMRKFKDGQLIADSKEPQIHNGADDNASGVSGLIELAVQLQGPKPKRSILFVAFTAEESGLHGSKYLIEHMPVPLEKVVAMINMDMIGRLPSDSDRVQVFGVSTGSIFPALVESAAKNQGLTAVPTTDGGGRSDHAVFLRKNIPSIHLFTGTHSDYHKPSDDSGKINAEGGAKVVRMIGEIVRQLAENEAKPVFQEVKEKKEDRAAGDLPTYRVVMGLAPSYGDDGKPGMGVDAVTPDGPAHLAGMKAGDRIVRINDKKVGNVYDYMAATRGNKPGDAVDVIVLRGEQETILKVTLSGTK